MVLVFYNCAKHKDMEPPKRCTEGEPCTVPCYENKARSQELNLDNKCFQQIMKAQL